MLCAGNRWQNHLWRWKIANFDSQHKFGIVVPFCVDLAFIVMLPHFEIRQFDSSDLP